MDIVLAMCFLGTDTPNNKCLSYKKVLKWRFFNLECNNRPKIMLQNVKTYKAPFLYLFPIFGYQ